MFQALKRAFWYSNVQLDVAVQMPPTDGGFYAGDTVTGRVRVALRAGHEQATLKRGVSVVLEGYAKATVSR